jgi:DNA-binding response OmpR family regulator
LILLRIQIAKISDFKNKSEILAFPGHTASCLPWQASSRDIRHGQYILKKAILLYNNRSMNVLLIEDEEKVASFISRGLEEEGYVVEKAYDGKKGLELLGERSYDILLLDLMIPEIDGLQVLKNIRAWGISTPVLILTAKSSKEDVIKGLDSGSDDYLTKPFSFDELLARVRALLRRSRRTDTPLIVYKDMVLNPFNRRLAIASKESELTDKEFMILEFLLKNNEKPLTRKEIAEYVWQNANDSTNIVDVYVNFLRKKIESLSAKKYIHTVRGTGYILKEENEKA